MAIGRNGPVAVAFLSQGIAKVGMRRRVFGIEADCLSVFKDCAVQISFVQKRASVCKFAGRALVDGQLVAEANFTAMIADPPKA